MSISEAEFKYRYLVFGEDHYYPSGGTDDVIFATDDLEEARNKAAQSRYDTVYIYDQEERQHID